MKNVERMGKRMGRIEQIGTDFFILGWKTQQKIKKSVPICPICPIRSPIRATLFCLLPS
jgi:hypothetical protein